MNSVTDDTTRDILRDQLAQMCRLVNMWELQDTTTILELLSVSDVLRYHMVQMCRLVNLWELKDATTILELAVWKAKIESENTEDSWEARQIRRKNAGAEMNVIVKSIFQFFDFDQGLRPN